MHRARDQFIRSGELQVVGDTGNWSQTSSSSHHGWDTTPPVPPPTPSLSPLRGDSPLLGTHSWRLMACGSYSGQHVPCHPLFRFSTSNTSNISLKQSPRWARGTITLPISAFKRWRLPLDIPILFIVPSSSLTCLCCNAVLLIASLLEMAPSLRCKL